MHEPPSGLEPETPSLPWKCSTTELRRHLAEQSSLPRQRWRENPRERDQSKINKHRGASWRSKGHSTEATARKGTGYWSGRRDSNSRPSAWKADALPTELLPLVESHLRRSGMSLLWAGKDSNLRTRLRTDLQSVAFNRSATCPNCKEHCEEPAGELVEGLEPPTC